MKIERLETILVGERHLFLKIYTDEGLVGLGESGLWGAREGVVGTLNRMAPVLIGQDVERIHYIKDKLYTKHQFKGMNVMSAIAAVDLALWDIRGKMLEVPVYKLIGGAYRDRIRLWWALSFGPVEQIKEEAARAREEGWTAVRINPLRGTADMSTPKRLKTVYERVAAIREAVGDDLDIGIEIHRELDADDTIRVCNMLEELGIMFYEDPHPSENINTMKYVSAKTRVPIAAGERCTSIQEFEMLFEAGMRYARPDITTLGGLTDNLKVAAIAESHHAGVIPHIATSVINFAASLHFSAAIPNFTIMETGPEKMLKMVLDSMGEDKFVIQKGHMLVPQGPGWGVELADDLTKRFPYQTTKWVL